MTYSIQLTIRLNINIQCTQKKYTRRTAKDKKLRVHVQDFIEASLLPDTRIMKAVKTPSVWDEL